MKLVFWDIETTPLLAWVWGRKPDYIPYQNIEQEWRIICASWMYEGSEKAHTAVSNNGCDKAVVEELYEMFADSDVLVHHNGDQFDFKRVVTRGGWHNLKPPNKPKTVDTLKQARSKFGLTSNKLDDIAEYFGLPRKRQVDMKDFIACAKGDAGAIKKLVKYNRRDVKVQKEIYNRLKPYLDTPNMTLYHNIPRDNCAKCGSANTVRRGYHFTKSGKYQQYQCRDCGGWFRATRSIKLADVK